ncbi:MAG: glutamate mutase L [Prevotellaceae bacterium]|jgi:uncharacterized protein (TIGR01319 family)|nr:glutamate mutase L [Prevotellaceae bacterium]
MNYLTVDFGSTFTKLTAVDSVQQRILATANAFTTVESDVMDGFNVALEQLEHKIGKFNYEKLLCCSSAAGGLKMVAVGLVPELTAKAAKMAASSAGAKVIKTYSFELSKKEQDEIYDINPDLVLLCGGTDGGNKEVIIQNAKSLCSIERKFSIIVAGNKTAAYPIEQIIGISGKHCVVTENVMPAFNKLNIIPAKNTIRDMYIKEIINAKGLSGIQNITHNQIIPTPLAVMTACELLSQGTKKLAGIGEFVAVDLGGATTDVYSMSNGKPSIDNVVVKGLPEPFSKRTVEGDLGMRYSLKSLIGEIDTEEFCDKNAIELQDFERWIELCIANPESVAQQSSSNQIIEDSLAAKAIDIAMERHCGEIESTYTPMGEIFSITGKDLTRIPCFIGIGGALTNSNSPKKILSGGLYSKGKYKFLKPQNPKFMLDKKYIFASMGLLSKEEPNLALTLLKDSLLEL